MEYQITALAMLPRRGVKPGMTVEPLTSSELARLISRGVVRLKVERDTSHRDYVRQWRQKRKQQKALASPPLAVLT